MQIAKIEDEYSHLIKRHFNDVVKNPIYHKDYITSEVVNGSIKNKICKCINHQPRYNLLKSGLDCVCDICKGTYPYNSKIPITDEYKNILNYLNINVTVNNYNNNNQNDDNNSILDIEHNISYSIFNDCHLTDILNQCLDGHKISDIAKLVKYKYPIFAYDNNDWYYCNKNNIWQHDVEEFFLKSKILELKDIITKISNFYVVNKHLPESSPIIKNIRMLKVKLSKHGFKDDIIKESKMLFHYPNFTSKLNSKKYLLAFSNGVYDLLSKSFRNILLDDYISFTCNYPYDPDINNEDVRKFVNSIITDDLFDYLLKMFSDSLNNNIYNSKHVLLIGNKSILLQLINLMNTTLGDFSSKIDMNSVNRKKTTNDLLNEKIKYYNKKFLYVHEYDDKKINLEQIIDFLFNDIVVNNITYSTEGKIFIINDKANDKVSINIENQGSNPNVIKIYCNDIDYDMNINVKISEDITWRQTFMNMLLEYYYKKCEEPNLLGNLTNKCSELSINDVFVWLENHIVLEEENVLNLKEICEYYYSTTVHSKIASKMRKDVENYLKDKYSEINGNYRDTTFKGMKVRGWIGIKYKA